MGERGGDKEKMETTSYEILVRLQIWARRDGRQWLVWCPVIDVMTQAPTQAQALESLSEAVALWFESCIERRVLDKALEECGFTRIPGNSQVSPEDTSDQVRIKTLTQVTPHPPVSIGRGSFSVARHRGANFIDGVIPAYIASRQLGDVALVRG